MGREAVRGDGSGFGTELHLRKKADVWKQDLDSDLERRHWTEVVDGQCLVVGSVGSSWWFLVLGLGTW